jgi:hypothetical protein
MLADVARRYALRLVSVADTGVIPGSYWGYPEAGLLAGSIYVAARTPVHSFLHELCHWVCMKPARRLRLNTDAGGSDAEENAVCYLQIAIASQSALIGKQRMLSDMDSWGYSFRLGSAAAWFENDAEDAHSWLTERELIDAHGGPTWHLRGWRD